MLSIKKCKPCERGVAPLRGSTIKGFMKELPFWVLKNGHLFRSYKLKDFKDAIDFINSIALLADEEGHHPEISIHYNRVDLEVWTHAIKGLSENDFILAAKIDKIQPY